MNIEKKYGVMIATPCYGGQLTEAYLHGILSTTVKAQHKGIQVHLNTMGNESLITRARNTLVTQFLDFDEKEPGRFTHLLFIDSDIGFNAENVIRLLPPLNVNKSEINLALKIINKVCRELK